MYAKLMNICFIAWIKLNGPDMMNVNFLKFAKLWREEGHIRSDDSSFSKRIKTPAEIEDELEDEYTDTKIKRAHLLGQTHLFD